MVDSTVTEQKKFGRTRVRKAPIADRLLTPNDLPDKGICYHLNHLRKLWKAGRFPRPIKLSPRKIAWREADLDSWIASKVEA
jgi:hypothetical protein